MRPFETSRRLALSASFALTSALLLATPREASANGRFPAATGVALDPVNPSSLLIRTTFGLLIVRDTGRIDWICEQLMGFTNTQDPMIAMTQDESIVIAPFEGLTVSHDGGCSFSKVTDTQGEVVIDIAVDKSNPARIVAITSTGTSSGFHNQTFESLDNGVSWHPVGPELGTDLLTETIDSAPSRPQRLYVSGFTGTGTQRQGIIDVSDDGGLSWERHDVDLAGDSSLYIAAVDPVDHDRVYVRTDGAEKDRLLVSTDGGKTFTPIKTLTGSMLGFAVSPDGSRIAFGGPSDGLYVGDRGATTFEQRDPNLPVACLAWSTTGLFACGSDFVNGFTVAKTTDEGSTWKPVMPSLQSVSGPLTTCPTDGPYQAACVTSWPVTQSQLGIDPNADAGVDGGNDGGLDGGTDAGATTPAAGSSSGGGCTVHHENSASNLTWLALIGAMVAARSRRRSTQG